MKEIIEFNIEWGLGLADLYKTRQAWLTYNTEMIRIACLVLLFVLLYNQYEVISTCIERGFSVLEDLRISASKHGPTLLV